MNERLANIEAVRESYKPVLTGEPRVIEVKEWSRDGSPMKLWIWPITLRQRQQITAYERFELMVVSIIIRAKDELGNPLFGMEQLEDFMASADHRVVVRVFNAIAAGDPTKDDVEKK